MTKNCIDRLKIVDDDGDEFTLISREISIKFKTESHCFKR